MKRQELRTWFNPTNRHEVFPRADVCRHIPFDDDEPSLLAQVAIAVLIVLAFVVMMFAPLIFHGY